MFVAHLAQSAAEPNVNSPIIFYDGVCGLCNNTVQTLLWLDRRQRKLKYAPLQGETAQQKLPPEWTTDLRTLVVVDDRGQWRFSSSIVRILWHLGGWCWLVGWLLWLIPRPIRDLGYRLVSSYRYRLFGKLDACRIPGPNERSCFLP